MTSRDQLQRVKDEIELSAYSLVTIDTLLLRTLISDYEQMRELLRETLIYNIWPDDKFKERIQVFLANK